MRVSLKDNLSISSARLDSQLFGCSSWETLTDSHPQQTSGSKSLSLKMGISPRDSRNTKLLCFQFQDQDSSSTQSTTGQSDSEVISMKDTNLHGQGHDETSGKLMGGQTKQVASMGTQEFVFPSQLDYGGQPIAHIPFHYPEPYFGGLLAAAAYGPQAMIHCSQAVGMAPARVPLPLDHLTEDEPIYVNAKQYCAILRRRQSRARLEAQSKLVKVRKPYLHESRHLHALKRARGSGGRFLTAKEVRGSKDGSGSEVCDRRCLENNKDGSSITTITTTTTTTFSEVTSGSNSEVVFRQQEFGLSGYGPHIVDSRGAGRRHHISALLQ